SPRGRSPTSSLYTGRPPCTPPSSFLSVPRSSRRMRGCPGSPPSRGGCGLSRPTFRPRDPPRPGRRGAWCRSPAGALPPAARPRPAAGGNAHREYVLPPPVERLGGHAIASVGLPCVGLPNLHAVEEGVVRIVDPPELEIDLRSFPRSVALVR